MRCLVLDRSSARPGMAVFEDGELRFEQIWDGEPTRVPEWIARTVEALAEHGWDVPSLGAFVCGLGPGSFSGIRACLSALQGMALPSGLPVWGVASAAALALGQGDGEVTVVGDARRNRLWCASYAVKAGRVCLIDGRAPTHTGADFQLVPAEALAQAVPVGTRVVSVDWDRLSGLLAATFPTARLVAAPVFPRPADVGRLALGDASNRVAEPLPIYLHPAVAAKE